MIKKLVPGGTSFGGSIFTMTGVHRALTLFGDAKQAMGEGKSGPVETRLNGPVAMALTQYFQLVRDGKKKKKNKHVFLVKAANSLLWSLPGSPVKNVWWVDSNS